MYKVREFIGSYNKKQFYSIMGKFFAERIYRKRMPYLLNDKDKAWYLFFKDNELIGFCGIKIGQHCTTFTDVFTNENYDEKEILLYVTEYMFNLYKSEKIRLLTCSPIEIQIWKNLGFKEIGHKGSYINLLWDVKHEN